MKKTQSYILAAYTIAFLAYYLLTFLLIEKSPAFWIGYLFTLISFLGAASIAYLTADPRRGDAFFGLPLIMVCNVYLAVQMVLGLILMLVAPSITVSIILELIPLALFAIVVVGAMMGRHVIESQEEQTRAKIGYLQELENELTTCLERCQDETLRSQLSQLREAVHYSDPMSHEALAGLEGQMLVLAGQIHSQMAEHPEQAAQSCHELELLLRERNRRCIQMK